MIESASNVFPKKTGPCLSRPDSTLDSHSRSIMGRILLLQILVGETANGTDDIWWITEGQDYPRLWWELIPAN